jgi:hypothetical protein
MRSMTELVAGAVAIGVGLAVGWSFEQRKHERVLGPVELTPNGQLTVTTPKKEAK